MSTSERGQIQNLLRKFKHARPDLLGLHKARELLPHYTVNIDLANWLRQKVDERLVKQQLPLMRKNYIRS